MIQPRAANLWLFPQLDGSVWAKYSCWSACASSQAAWSSDGAVLIGPVTMRSRTQLWTPAEHPTTKQLETLGPGNLSDERDALIHPLTVAAFKAAGLKAPKVKLLGTTTPKVVRSHLAAGHSASVALSYATINRLRPKSSGSPTFMGGHAGRLQGLYHRDGTPATPGDTLSGPGDRWFTDLVESLDDGRAKGIAKGPQRVPLGLVITACAECPIDDKGTRLGKGKVLAMVVWKAARIPAPPVDIPPPQPPIETDAQKIARLEQTSIDLRAQLATVDALVQAANAERDAARTEADRLAGVIRAMVAAAQDGAPDVLEQAAAAAGGDA